MNPNLLTNSKDCLSFSPTQQIYDKILKFILIHLFIKPSNQFADYFYSAQLINEITKFSLVSKRWFNLISLFLLNNKFNNQYIRKLNKNSILINKNNGFIDLDQPKESNQQLKSFQIIKENYQNKYYNDYAQFKNVFLKNNNENLNHNFSNNIIKIRDYSVPLMFEEKLNSCNLLPVELDLYLTTENKSTKKFLLLIKDLISKSPHVKIRKVKLVGADYSILNVIIELFPKVFKYNSNYKISKFINPHLDYSLLIQSSTIEKLKFYKSEYIDPHSIGLNLHDKIESLTAPILFHEICLYNIDKKLKTVNSCSPHIGSLNENIKYKSYELMTGRIASNRSLRELSLVNFCENSNCLNHVSENDKNYLNKGINNILLGINKIESLCIDSLDFINDSFYDALIKNKNIRTLIIKNMNLRPFLNSNVFIKNRNIRNLIIYNQKDNLKLDILKCICEILYSGADFFSISINYNLIIQYNHLFINTLNTFQYKLNELNIYYENKEVLKYRKYINNDKTILNY